MTSAVGMNAALSLDATGVKWPFTPHRRPVALRPTPRPAGAVSQAGIPAGAFDRQGVPAARNDTSAIEDAGRVTAIQGGAEFVALGSFAAAGVNLQVKAGVRLTRRQMLGDVALVAVWAAIIPGVLWFGHAAGF